MMDPRPCPSFLKQLFSIPELATIFGEDKIAQLQKDTKYALSGKIPGDVVYHALISRGLQLEPVSLEVNYDAVRKDHDASKRSFIGWGIAGIAAASGLFQVCDRLMMRFFGTTKVVQDEAMYFNNLDAWWGRVIGSDFRVKSVLGEGNQHLIASGISKYPSGYIRGAHARIAGGIMKIVDETVDTSHDSPLSVLDDDTNILALGGPVANELTRMVCGYTEDYVTEMLPGGLGPAIKILPVPDYESGLKMWFHVGLPQLGYGWFPNDNVGEYNRSLSNREANKPLVVRWNEMSVAQDGMQLYGVVDQDRRITPMKTNNGQLAQEGIMIIRRRNPFHPKRFVTVIGGVHGYSLKALLGGMDAEVNLKRVAEYVGKTDYYQMFVPAKVIGPGEVSLAWGRAECHSISGDIKLRA